MAINSLLLNALRKTRTVKAETPGQVQYLTDAVTYVRDFTSQDGADYTRTYIRGTDALTGVPVSNVELHTEAQLSKPTNVVLIKCHTRITRDPNTKAITGQYQHAMGFEALPKAEFQALVAAAAEAAANADVESETVI
jgi:hypothetical protein